MGHRLRCHSVECSNRRYRTERGGQRVHMMLKTTEKQREATSESGRVLDMTTIVVCIWIW